MIVDNVQLGGGKTELAQGTRSDRKDAKAVIHDKLGPRRPWRGTLSSSDRVPFASGLFVAARFILVWVVIRLNGPLSGPF
ncbi:hypothetical protein ACJ2_20270 [Pantoea sp. QMID2]|nr:hypothetical protein ACJ3_12970 [Pantoea sp. QMID3]GME34467.1 hypothetical protein ACJ1_12890 [Pantoea sp. QMID1]GME55664.1 hypothetical protein ACJ4_20250 [Pantoea sp. QMID4]GME56699.1 hypothetical protein ACJ2_20270 [Pantoea sp. QMID2]